MPETPGLEFLRTCRRSSAAQFADDSSPEWLPRRGIEEAIARGELFRVLRKPWTRVDLTLGTDPGDGPVPVMRTTRSGDQGNASATKRSGGTWAPA